MLKEIVTILALTLGLAAPLRAEDMLSDIVHLDVLDGGQTRAGTHMAALRLRLNDGWKTYWRAPGEAGIPPTLHWRGSRNVASMRIVWPTPKVMTQNGMHSVVYEDQMVLPLEITPKRPGQPVRLKGRIEFGICKDICVPGELDISADLDSAAPRHPAIAAALAARPYSARDAGVQAVRCALSPSDRGLQLEVRVTMPSAGGTEYAVVETGNPDFIAGEAQTRREGGTLIARTMLSASGQGALALDRSALRITVLGRAHAVDIRGCTAG